MRVKDNNVKLNCKHAMVAEFKLKCNKIIVEKQPILTKMGLERGTPALYASGMTSGY